MEANEVLTKAWAAVKESGVPESLYEAAFKEAVALIAKPASDGPAGERGQRPNSGASANSGAAQDETVKSSDTDAALQRFASESGIDASELIEVFYFDPDGTPHLNVAGRKLGSSTTARAKAVATAITAAYYFADDEVQISVEKIRAECERLKCYDVKNFYNHMGSATGTVLSGAGNSRALRAKPNEIEAALRSVVNTIRGTKE